MAPSHPLEDGEVYEPPPAGAFYLPTDHPHTTYPSMMPPRSTPFNHELISADTQERHELFLLAEGEKKVTFQTETRKSQD